MPISPVDGYPISHWNNVQSLLEEVIESAGLIPNLVSSSDEVNIIQNTIVTNLYEYDIISLVRSFMLVKEKSEARDVENFYGDIVDFSKNIKWIQDYEDEDEVRNIQDLIFKHGV